MLELDYARRCERREVDLLCEVVARNWDEPIPYRVTDLSPYGMWITTSFPLDVGESAVVSLQPPNGEELHVYARVVRSVRAGERGGRRTSGMGLELVGLTPEEKASLRRSTRGCPPARRH